QESVENLDLQVVVILDTTGRVIYGRSFPNGAGQDGLAGSLSEWITLHPAHARFPDKAGKADGMIGLPQGLLLFSSRPILDDYKSFPVAGTLVMGRLFDQDEVTLLEQRLLVTVSIYPLVGPPVSASIH